MKRFRLRWLQWLSPVPLMVVVAIWIASHTWLVGGYWAPLGTRYELASYGGQLVTMEFRVWKRYDPLRFEYGLISEEEFFEPQFWRAGCPGWRTESEGRLAGFVVAHGWYLPPFALQLPSVDFHLTVVPWWFLAAVAAALPLGLALRYLRRKTASVDSPGREARPWISRLTFMAFSALVPAVAAFAGGVACLLAARIMEAPPFPLHDAIAAGDMPAVERLVNSGAALDAEDAGGQTPLALAVADGQTQMVDFLLSKGASVNPPVNPETRFRQPPLHAAVRSGHTELARLLLARGTDVDAADWAGRTSLHYAAGGDDPELVELLLAAGARVDARDAVGQTPLIECADLGKKEVAEMLLARGADVNAATTREGQTPLHVAALYGNEDVARVLLKAGADVGRKDKDGHTPLDLAKSEGHAKIVEILTKQPRRQGR